MLLAALFGFGFAWLGSMPVAGPVAALVMKRGIEGRARAGLQVALGGALPEAMYACLAFWGFCTFLVRYPVIVPISRALAAVALAAIGITMLRRRDSGSRRDRHERRDGGLASFFLGFSVGLLNPALLATWAAVVTTMYATELVSFDSRHAVPFAAGVLAGVVGWHSTMLWAIRRFRHRFSQRTLGRVVRVCGAGLCLLSLWFAWRFASYFVA